METLAIVAYTQPDARSGGERARRELDSSINSLVEKGPRARGGDHGHAGQPTLYATTRARFWRSSVCAPLPIARLSEFAPDDSTRTLIRERLSAAHRSKRYAALEARRGVLDRVGNTDDEEGDMSGAVAGEALVGHTAPESLFSQDAGFRAAASRDEAEEDRRR